ncbi:MAG: hypothetical protein GX630_04715 [Actinobacteria bacterium]|nr:hypothetical protein [Actinomycetota bacterium]
MASVRDQIGEVLYNAVSVAMNKPVADLADSTQLVADLGAKSANLVRIISVIEDELELDVSYQEFSRRKTLGDIIDYLVELDES